MFLPCSEFLISQYILPTQNSTDLGWKQTNIDSRVQGLQVQESLSREPEQLCLRGVICHLMDSRLAGGWVACVPALPARGGNLNF